MKKVVSSNKVSFNVRLTILVMLIVLSVSFLVVPVFAAQMRKQLDADYVDIKIVIDGELITPKDANGNIVEPFVVNGTTYLPVRAICEAIGYNVEWDGTTKTVLISSDIDYAK